MESKCSCRVGIQIYYPLQSRLVSYYGGNPGIGLTGDGLKGRGDFNGVGRRGRLQVPQFGWQLADGAKGMLATFFQAGAGQASAFLHDRVDQGFALLRVVGAGEAVAQGAALVVVVAVDLFAEKAEKGRKRGQSP